MAHDDKSQGGEGRGVTHVAPFTRSPTLKGSFTSSVTYAGRVPNLACYPSLLGTDTLMEGGSSIQIFWSGEGHN